MTFSLRTLFGTSFVWWLLAALLGAYWILPLKQHINFGIDLVGGTYISLEVMVDKAVEQELQSRTQSIAQQSGSQTFAIAGNQAIITFKNEVDAQNAQSLIEKNIVNVTRDGAKLVARLAQSEIDTIAKEAVASNVEVLRTRLDRFGVGEVAIAAQGENKIVIELPSVDDIRQAKDLIGTSALLEFKIVEDYAITKDELLARYGGAAPEGFEILPSKENRFYLVQKLAEVTGRDLKDSRADYAPEGAEIFVYFSFKPDGQAKFANLTGSNIGRNLAIVLDDMVISAPTINVRIDGPGFIQGNFTADSAKELATLLKSGAFVAPVKFEQERHIGPSLGEESIRSGLLSCLVGLGLLLVFSVGFYKTAGLLAFFVLLYNLFLILLALALFGATLTLPGIAGMVLTVGMAIDSSILIYERIRELLAHGMPMRQAVSEGFSNAMGVILDANITTLIVGLVLYKLGSGPVQGFAVTMMIGIISTLVTGLLLLRSLFSFVFDVLKLQKISI